MPPELPDHAEAGTQNVCGICGLAAGLRFVRQQSPQRLLAHGNLPARRLLASMLEDIPGIRLFTGEAQSGTLSLCAAQTDCETLAARLASEGLCVRAGLHCAPLAHESAGTLETGTVRFSLSAFNTERESKHWKSQSTSEAASNNAARHAPASAPLVRKGKPAAHAAFFDRPIFSLSFLLRNRV